MADVSADRDPGEDTRPEPDREPPRWVAPTPTESTGGTPRWVKVFGIIGVIVVALIVVMLLSGHGPGRHTHGGLGGYPTAGSVTAPGGIEPGAQDG